MNDIKELNIKDLKIDISIKKYLNDCIKNDKYKNMLFCGNPGTGKTTTATVFINSYIKKHVKEANKSKNVAEQELKKNVLKLNASVFRNTNEFVSIIRDFLVSTTIYYDCAYKKIILLDEIDYMTPHGQNSLMMLMKSFDNVIFICMCNYLSKIVDDLREYFIIFNYNCFGSLIQNYIKKSNDKNKSKLLEYILDGSDIRMYNNELYRINLLHSDDINTLLQKMDLSVNIIYEKLVGRDKISDIDDVFNDVIDILREVETKTGICYNKIKLIIINKVIEKMYELNKVCIENKLDFIENVINN